jgi:hypothetical protein
LVITVKEILNNTNNKSYFMQFIKGKLITVCTIFILLLLVIPISKPGLPFNNFSDVKLYKDGCCEGYTLCSVLTSTSLSIEDENYALLIDMDGNEINRWPGIPVPAKGLPGGSVLLYTGEAKVEGGFFDTINITQKDWDGSVEWNFCNWEKNSDGIYMARAHHDFQREGNPVGYYAPNQDFVNNGNTLVLSYTTVPNPDFSRKMIFDIVIYEVNCDGSLTDFVWYASDHIDEMGFSLKEKIGIWLNPGGPGIPLMCPPGDWIHINSVSYLGENKWYNDGDERFNPENILICSRHASIIAIISKETGNIVWKIGPDFSKHTNEGQKLGKIIGPHGPHLIPKELPGAGNILLFDNGGLSGYGIFGWPKDYRSYSRVIEFNPITLKIVQEYTHKDGLSPFPRQGDNHKFYSSVMGFAQRLPNGNTLITESKGGRIFEINAKNEILWEYLTPKITFDVYRAYRIPPEWIPENPSNYDIWFE